MIKHECHSNLPAHVDMLTPAAAYLSICHWKAGHAAGQLNQVPLCCKAQPWEHVLCNRVLIPAQALWTRALSSSCDDGKCDLRMMPKHPPVYELHIIVTVVKQLPHLRCAG